MDEDEAPRFNLWLHQPTGNLWVVDPVTMRASGPVPDADARATLRHANDWVDDGCSRGPKTWGFFQLRPRPAALPFPVQEWCPFEPEWLPA